MKKEVEILVEVFDKKKFALKKLSGLKFLGDKKIVDIYLFDSKREDLKPDKHGQLKKSLRIRSKDNEASITYKVDHFNKEGVWLYSDEHETVVNNYDETREIFSKLGFKELVRIENIKSTFVNDKYEIVIEDVKNLGIFMEVERLKVGPREDIIEIKKEIWDWIKSLNINISRELAIGKPELMLRKNNNI